MTKKYDVRSHGRGPLRPAFTLIELLVVMAIIAILAGLTLSGVQHVRAAAARTRCAANLRQIALAAHQYHDVQGRLPPGRALPFHDGERPVGIATMTWHTRVLPFVEQEELWRAAVRTFADDPTQTVEPLAVVATVVVPVFLCPLQTDLISLTGRAYTSYLGVAGTKNVAGNGVLFYRSRVRLVEIADGASNTFMIGERPPPRGRQLGQWLGGWAQSQTGEAANVLGVREIAVDGHGPGCPMTPQHFGPGSLDNICDAYHFWSQHSGGAHFALADGAVRFVRYSIDPNLPALATRAGGEVVQRP